MEALICKVGTDFTIRSGDYSIARSDGRNIEPRARKSALGNIAGRIMKPSDSSLNEKEEMVSEVQLPGFCYLMVFPSRVGQRAR